MSSHDRSRALEKPDCELLCTCSFSSSTQTTRRRNDHRLQTAERYVEERPFVIEAALEYDRVKARVESQDVAVGLADISHSRHQCSSGRLGVELSNQPENEPRYLGEQATIVSEEWSQRFRHGEHELPVWQVKQRLLRDNYPERG